MATVEMGSKWISRYGDRATVAARLERPGFMTLVTLQGDSQQWKVEEPMLISAGPGQFWTPAKDSFIGTKLATDVQPGDYVVEGDGAALEVVKATTEGRRVNLQLKSMMGPVTATIKASARVRVALVAG